MLQNAFLGFFTNAKIFLKALRADRVSKGVFLTYVIEVLQLLGAGPYRLRQESCTRVISNTFTLCGTIC